MSSQLSSLLDKASRLIGAHRGFEAVPVLEQALPLAVGGPKHAIILYRLGFLLEAVGEHQRARSYFETWLNVTPGVLNSDPDATQRAASVLSALGRCNLRLMHYRDALARHEEAYRLWESALGEGDPNTITAVDELAYTYELMGDLSMAERMLKKVVQLRERFLGAYHPVTLETRELLAELHDRERKPDWEIELDGYVKGFRDLLSTGDSAGAGHLLKRISEIILYIPMPARERELGTLNVLAAECETQGRPQIQVLCAGAAVRIATQTYGPGSAQTVKFASNLAYAHAAAREFTKAIRINEECLEHRRKLFGPDHPDVALSLNNLAQIHLESGKSDLALKLTHEALRIDQHAYGETHDATAGDLHNIGIAHLKKREHAHARRFFCRAVDIWYALHPAGHMHLAIALKNLGNSYEIEGYDVAARDYYAKAYGMLKKTAGDNHPVTVKTHDALSALDARSLISDEPNPLTSVSFHTSRSRQAYTW